MFLLLADQTFLRDKEQILKKEGWGGGGEAKGEKLRSPLIFRPKGSPLISGSGWPPLPPNLKVWIRHCLPLFSLDLAYEQEQNQEQEPID